MNSTYDVHVTVDGRLAKMQYSSVMPYAGLSTGRTNFERPNLQHHHLNECHLILGRSLVPANNGQDLKSVRAQKAYRNDTCCVCSLNDNIIFYCKKACLPCLACRRIFSGDSCEQNN
jgi:hypothetical protein